MVNVSTDSIKGLKFGYGFLGSNKTIKLRYSCEKAVAIINLLPAHVAKDVMIVDTMHNGKSYSYLAYVAPPSSYAWIAISKAIEKVKR